MEGRGEISSDSSAVMLELLHMEMVSLFSSLDHKECQSKLEQLGRRVGATMAEQMTKDIPRFKNELDVLVFVCKQFWQQAWHKPVDNLKTNHQDVYVLLDNSFKLLSKMSSSEQYKSQAALYLSFPCGLIKGALTTLGISCHVTADVIEMPSCTFQVKVTTQ